MMERKIKLDYNFFPGEFGPYQRRQVILLILGAVTAGVHMLSLVTVAAIPEHRFVHPNKMKRKN